MHGQARANALSSTSFRPFGQFELRSRTCVLTPVRGTDATFIRALWGNQAFMHDFHRLAPPLPASDLELVARLEQDFRESGAKSAALNWIIRTPAGKPVGMLTLTALSRVHRRGEVMLGVLPDAPFGIATAAMLMIFELYFKTLPFNKLYSFVFADNRHSLKGTLHLGFRIEGELRQHVSTIGSRSLADQIRLLHGALHCR
jgi:RimJ/RimL family protein N-acetyltransferase